MFKWLKTLAVSITVTSILVTVHADAAMYALPSTLRKPVDTISFVEPMLPPFAYSRFCVHYSDDCRVHGFSFRRPKPVMLTAEHLKDLVEVNRSVNRRIIPTPYLKANYYDSWSISPKRGDCNDFAVTKRHELLARGWPSRALLLAEVIVPNGEHHMILVARTSERDFVLDNLSPALRSWTDTPYTWVRVQSPYKPMIWSTIKSTGDA